MKTFHPLFVVATCLMFSVLCGRPALAEPASRAQPAASAVARGSTMPAPTVAGVVNINEASSEQLQLLPGVGPSRADAIVTFRKSHPFKRIEDLTRIKGIGRKSLLRLRALLSISGPTTLRERPTKASSGSPVAQHQTGSLPASS